MGGKAWFKDFYVLFIAAGLFDTSKVFIFINFQVTLKIMRSWHCHFFGVSIYVYIYEKILTKRSGFEF